MMSVRDPRVEPTAGDVFRAGTKTIRVQSRFWGLDPGYEREDRGYEFDTVFWVVECAEFASFTDSGDIARWRRMATYWEPVLENIENTG